MESSEHRQGDVQDVPLETATLWVVFLVENIFVKHSATVCAQNAHFHASQSIQSQRAGIVHPAYLILEKPERFACWTFFRRGTV